MEMREVESAIEGILFASGEPVHIDRICLALDMDRPTVEQVLHRLSDQYAFDRRGIRLLQLEDSWQMCSAPDYADIIRRAFEIRKPAKLSQPALEVLTIIAYYQPTTRAYVDQIRGVDSAYTIGLLLDRKLIEECGRLGISVLPPHVNFSEAGFTVVGKSIRFGLLAVKNLGRGVIARMVEERRGGGEFTSFYNFCKRMAGRELNRRAIESLIKCGALDNLGNNRREMLLSVESVLDALEADKRRNVEGQMGFFDTPGSSQAGEPPLDKAEDFSAVDKLNMEKEVTGMYLSGHPMSAYAGLYQEGGYARMDEILQSAGEEGGRYQDGQWVTVLGLVTAVRKKATKSSSQMAFVTLEDMYGALTALVFSRPLEQYGSLLYEGSVVEVSGKLSFTEEKEPELVCQSMAKPAEPTAVAGGSGKQVRPGLYLRLESESDPRYRKAMQYIAIFDGGSTQLYLTFRDTGKLLRAPAKYLVDMNRPLLRALQELLGKDNVAYFGPKP